MPDENLRKRIDRMTDGEAEARFEELRERYVPTVPTQLDGTNPEAMDLNLLEEFQLLKKRLGYS